MFVVFFNLKEESCCFPQLQIESRSSVLPCAHVLFFYSVGRLQVSLQRWFALVGVFSPAAAVGCVLLLQAVSSLLSAPGQTRENERGRNLAPESPALESDVTGSQNVMQDILKRAL